MLTVPEIDAAIAELDAFLSSVDQLVLKDKKPRRIRTPRKKLQKLLAESEPKVANDFLKAVSMVQDGTRVAAVRDAYQRGDIESAVNLVPWAHLEKPELKQQLLANLTAVYEGAAAATNVSLSGLGDIAFESDRAVAAMTDYGARLVTMMTDEGKTALRQLLAEATTEGLSANSIQAMIRPTIGLNGPQSIALLNRYVELSDSGLSGAALDEAVARYADELQNARALMIARTESQFALNIGQRDSWSSAADQGLFDPETAQRIWRADPNSCEICLGYDGMTVPFDAEFPQGDPPAHPHCSCLTDLELGEDA